MYRYSYNELFYYVNKYLYANIGELERFFFVLFYLDYLILFIVEKYYMYYV